MMKVTLFILALFAVIGAAWAAGDLYLVDNSQYDINFDNNPSFPGAINQTNPDYALQNLQSQAASPTLNYQKLNLIELNRQAKIKSDALQEMQKNDENQARCMENNTAAAYVESIPGQNEYNPVYGPSSEDK